MFPSNVHWLHHVGFVQVVTGSRRENTLLLANVQQRASVSAAELGSKQRAAASAKLLKQAHTPTTQHGHDERNPHVWGDVRAHAPTGAF